MATAATAPSLPPPSSRQLHGHYTPKSQASSAPGHPPQSQVQEQQEQHIPTADALFEALAQQSHVSSAGIDQGLDSIGDPLAVRVQQLPTPRTSFSSGAPSPPENQSPSVHISHPVQHQYSYLTPTSMASSASSSASSTPNSTVPSTVASTPRPNHGPPNPSTSPTIKSPLSNGHLYQPQSYPALRSTSPSLNAGAALDPSSFGPSSSSNTVSTASTSTAFNTHYNVSGIYNMGGPASGLSNTLESRLPANQAQSYQDQQFYQQQDQFQYDDDKELQKKNARSALNGVAAFLPPAVNQGLTKVVQTAQAVVNSSSNGKLSLPSNRPLDGYASSTNGFSTRSSASSAAGLSVDPSSIRGMLIKFYKVAKLPGLCLLWYLSSAVTNNIGKQIMNQFRYPVTLTFVQFVFVSFFCSLLGLGPGPFRMTTIRRPTKGILQMTAPLVGFQVVGHVFSSVAISRVPLSVVHTIKALSPVFTVVFYRIILGTTYNRAVYISLVPLTAGVMLACRLSLEFNNLVGLVCALASTLVFVTQNVFTKRILFSTKAKQQQQQALGGLGNKEATREDDTEEEIGSSNAQKLDKINILFYSSTMAAMCMIPIWLYAEGLGLMFPDESAAYSHMTSGHGSGFWAVSWLLFLNGVSHFFQNIFAFSVLALTSPVTYSIASLIKRIVVIVASIVYFHQTLGMTQWTGVCLTFWGLWLYNSAKNAAKINPKSGILAGTKVGRRMSRNFGRGLLDSSNSKGGFLA
ncbi:suppressor of loss of ypt1 [Mortierella polycephala]|uniref:Suppressor of loss of ypt1 n=1 Tax=Mortierella polycephala TaxID=41804 RepID=A0A9P6PPF5_9FUNG|nr:suppressor of loss of ypt1 [Mortierella polycephala]